MESTFIAVRDVEAETFRRFKAMSVKERLKLGDALTIAMNKLIEEKEVGKKKNVKHLMALKPFSFGKGNEKLSKEVDKVLYG
ncbi:MAG: hypothetical protein AABW80_00265 [Nanoarchaeota archaeon]